MKLKEESLNVLKLASNIEDKRYTLVKLNNEINELINKLIKLNQSILTLEKSLDSDKVDEFTKYNHSLILLDDVRELQKVQYTIYSKLLLFEDIEKELEIKTVSLNRRLLLKKLKEIL